MEEIKAILFDADGVIQFPGTFIQHVEIKYGWEEPKYRSFISTLFHESQEYRLSLEGKGDFLKAIKELLPVYGWKASPQEFIKDWFKYNIVIDEKIWSNISYLRKNGFKCYLASSQEINRLTYMIDELKYAKQFDDMFITCCIGHQKPSTEYFNSIIHSLQIEPQKILFFDDTLKNVLAAKELGIKSEQYTSYDNYLEIIRRYNIIL